MSPILSKFSVVKLMEVGHVTLSYKKRVKLKNEEIRHQLRMIVIIIINIGARIVSTGVYY